MKFAATTLLIPTALAFTGRMTYYQPGLGACGKTNSANDAIVAIGHDRWTSSNPNKDPLCSKSINISHNGKTVKAKVVDKCMGCGANDIDVSPAIFKQFGSLGTGVIQVNWNFV
ncbi:hypothetical protein JX265_010855 [Neoarthrinium moseri]|uniref:RlpA-like protein double-psi beta-barrel domain-containing protein n=1 Tax=Neoarthrinium moseri TaxID=1658444 RepID=A0A9P9WDB6_9PEZI|nr:uncharacterized protein JN550_010579 [Neoarthrinium moseri]KAI1839775.1 hypothetical protein JX266_014015 [Neoarthrinium moseri]KAI1858187.1 hypothetical protein JX265_010855 [Neoarthrinium moseri]KAI1861948.1 hypothetical protein JN550_010579 [Neoarthrinium moseri]